jgi:hypothetical protein
VIFGLLRGLFFSFCLFPEVMMAKERILLVRVAPEDLELVSGGIMLKLVVTHANIRVEVEDDGGHDVAYRRAELTGTK